MSQTRTTALQDTTVDVKIVLAGLWTAMLFVFAYVDIFGFFRADVIEGALAGEIPDLGFTIDQGFLLATTAYILVPSLMIVVSLMARSRVNRLANIVLGLVYAASVAVSMIGETWAYYLVGSIVEIVLLLGIARVAWTWPRRPAA